MSSTVTDGRHRFGDARVNNISGNVQRSRRWSLRRRQAEPQAAPVERSPYPNPAGDTQILQQVQIKPVTPPVLYRERPADLDKAACNITLAATTSRLHGWSAIKLEEQLAVHMRVVHGLAEQERAEGRKLLTRHHAAAAAVDTALSGVRSVVASEEAANRLPGVTVNAVIDTGALGSELTAVTANAHDLSDATMTFQPITADMADPRVRVSVATVTVDGPASPVRVPGDGARPPLPDDADETADPGADAPHATALPKRTPHPVHIMPAPMSDGENPQPIGLHPQKPAYGEVHGGDWVFDDSADAAVLKLVKQVTVARSGSGDPVSARVFFEDGSDRRVKGDRTVRVLGAADAVALLERYGAQVAQLEAAS